MHRKKYLLILLVAVLVVLFFVVLAPLVSNAPKESLSGEVVLPLPPNSPFEGVSTSTLYELLKTMTPSSTAAVPPRMPPHTPLNKAMEDLYKQMAPRPNMQGSLSSSSLQDLLERMTPSPPAQ